MPIDFHGDDDRLDFSTGDALDFEPRLDLHERGAPWDIGPRSAPAAAPAVERHDVPQGRGRGRGISIWDWERERDDHPGRGRGPPSKPRGLTLHDRPERGQGKGRKDR